MEVNLKVVLPLASRDAGDESLYQKELAAAQAYFDSTVLGLNRSTVYFVPLKGMYTHLSRKMALLGAFVNMTDNIIVGVKGTVSLRLDHSGAEAALVHIKFPSAFMGRLHPREALLVQLDVPVKRLRVDKTFEASEFVSEFLNVEVIHPEEELTY